MNRSLTLVQALNGSLTSAHVYSILKLLIMNQWTSKMLLFFSQSWSWDNCYSNIFGVKIYSLLCNFFSYLTLWLRNSVDFRSLHRSCCFSVASLVGEFPWSAKFVVLIIPTRCSVPCNRVAIEDFGSLTHIFESILYSKNCPKHEQQWLEVRIVIY